MKRRHFARLALTALLPYGAVKACEAEAQALTTIRVATPPSDAQIFMAEDKGFLKANGLDGDIQVVSNGAAIVAAVLAGSIDIAQSNLVSLCAAHAAGTDVVLIAGAGQYSSKAPSAELVVGAKSPYKAAKDLTGRIVAGNGVKNITQVGAYAWLAQNGVDPASIKFVEMPFPQMPDALNVGRIDAAVIAEPSLSAAVSAGTVRVLAACFNGIANDFLIGGWFASGAWAQAHPDIVKRFQKAMAQTAAWANTQQSESGALITKYTKVAVSPTMARTVFALKLDGAMIQPLIDASARYGAIPKAFAAKDLIAPNAL